METTQNRTLGPKPVGRLLRPRSVAIVGASPDAGSIGFNALENLLRAGYQGEIHLVSRSRKEINGRPCVPSIDDLPLGVDAVVLVVPEAVVVDSVAACARRQAGSAVVFASGFAEVGAEGKAKQDRIREIARESGVLVLGPNCIGLRNFAGNNALTFEPVTEPAPTITEGAAVIAQSGAMTSNLKLALFAKGVPVTCAISTGNEAVLGVEDFLADCLDQPGNRVFALFIEQVRRPAVFLDLVRRARREGKPIVLLHPGRTAIARETAKSHTGAFAGDYQTMRAILTHEGVVLVDTMDELFDTTTLLARWPEPSPLPVGAISNSGAFRGISLDMAADIGLELAALTAETKAKLKAMLPAYATIDNPLDITTVGLAQPQVFGNTAQAVLDDPGVGGLVLAFIPGAPEFQMVRCRSLLPAIEHATKPVAFSMFGDETKLIEEFPRTLRERNVPLFRSPDRALRAMAHVSAYGRARMRAAVSPKTLAQSVTIAERGPIAEYRAKAYLKELGIAVPAGSLVMNVDHACAVAEAIGYPVVLKAQSPALLHKSDAGGVIVGIKDAAALRTAWPVLHENVARAKPCLALDGVLVEAMAKPGVELIVGARRDPEWGPVLMIGLGGIWTEALKDVALLSADLGDDEIIEALARLKGAALLDGLRGAPPSDKRAVAQVAASLGALMRATPDLLDIEINPLMVYPSGAIALDALMIAAETPAKTG
ncbi:MAG TPA: acetate--CoA ligase family protein [Stellaceae bacterium]|nr:acetate--CoA ligase family protein [Stellaceae bacterium]